MWCYHAALCRIEKNTWAIVFPLVTFLPKTETSPPPTLTKLVVPPFSSIDPPPCECIRARMCQVGTRIYGRTHVEVSVCFPIKAHTPAENLGAACRRLPRPYVIPSQALSYYRERHLPHRKVHAFSIEICDEPALCCCVSMGARRGVRVCACALQPTLTLLKDTILVPVQQFWTPNTNTEGVGQMMPCVRRIRDANQVAHSSDSP